MRLFIAIAFSLGCFGSCETTVCAQDAGPAKFDPAARAAAIAPLVDDQTLVVAHVSLRKVDYPATAKRLTELVGVPREFSSQLTALSQRFVTLTDELAKLDVADLYFVVRLPELVNGPGYFVVAAPKHADDAASVAKALNAGSPADERVAVAYKGCVLLGHFVRKDRKGGHDQPDAEVSQWIASLKGIKQVARPELAKAFEVAGDTTAQVLFLTSDDSRRVIGELLPRLPAEIGGGPTAPLVEGCLWAAVGIDLPPKKLSVRLVIQSRDAAAAKAFETALAGLFGGLAKRPEVQAIVPKFDELAKLLSPRVEGDRLVLTLDDEQGQLKSLANLIQAPVEKAQISAKRAKSVNNLKQLGLAMHGYYDTKKSCPPAASYDSHGKPLLSWRVLFLQYLDSDLYKEFHLDEPWDSEHNRKLIDRMPDVFRSPLSNVKDAGRTTYLLPVDSKHFVGGREVVKPAKPGESPPDVSNALFFGGRKGGTFQQITDGTSNTIMIVEADDAHAVIWTRPDDLTVDLDDPLKGLENKATGGFNSAYFDGSVRFIPNTMSKKNLRATLTPAGGEVVER